ncbi:MAG: hypothetical protein HKN48_00470 [Flavobacteriaceae bacterium]|nr:hypothetical protein [Flavobacteriaceae bacterium]
MKSFYLKILLFLLPVFLVWGGLEYFYRTVETNYTFKHKQIQASYDDTEILIMGNSHTLYGLNPEFFSRPTFNLANTSQSLYFDELLLEKHLDSLSNLKAVVLAISYFSLSQADNTSDDIWRKYFYQEQMDLEVPIISEIDPRGYSLALTRKFNRSYEFVKEYWQNGTALGCYENGYGIQDSTDIVRDIERIAPIIAKKHENGSMEFDNAISRLERIIKRCAKHNVEVFLVEMPVHPLYYQLLNEEKKYKIVESCTQLDSKLGNAHYISLSLDQRFQKSDLRDADHLTNQGAEKCSRILDGIVGRTLSN